MHNNLILKHLDLLLVDDNRSIHAEMYALFSAIFKSITLAHNAETAMQHYVENNVDIILTDIEMPDVDGLSLVENIRSSNALIPIVIVSAHTDKEYLLRAANLQIDGYITKPLNFKKLSSTLTRAVSRLEHRVQPITISKAVSYHPLEKALKVDNQEVSLGNKECLLLELLLQNSHRIVSKAEIYSSIWPNTSISESALKNLLGELRRKLKYDVIKNQPARGWTLSVNL